MLKKLKEKPLFVVFFTVFVDLLGFGILLPILPVIFTDPASEFFVLSSNTPVSYGFVLLGLLVAIYPLMQFFAAPILGQLSDKIGRRKVLIFSLLGTAVSYVIFALGIVLKNVPLLFFARAFDGITGGNISVAKAAVADITDHESRSRGFGLIGTAFGLGFILGPFVGGKLSDPNLISWFNAATPFWFAAILGFLNMISVFMFFPETLKNLQLEKYIRWGDSIRDIAKAFKIKHLRNLFVSEFIFYSGFAIFGTFMGVFLLDKFMFTQSRIGDFFSYIGIWIILTQSFIMRPLSRRFKEYKIITYTLPATGLAIFLFLIPSSAWVLFLIAPFVAIFNGLSQVNMSTLISKSAGETVQGQILGINSSVQALAQVIPPALSGLLAASLSAGAAIWSASIVVIMAGILYFLLYIVPHRLSLQ